MTVSVPQPRPLDPTRFKSLTPTRFKPIGKPAAKAIDEAIGIQPGQRVTRAERAAQYRHLLAVEASMEHLVPLPKPGESVHMVLAGNWNLWDCVPALLGIIAPATIRRLDVSTLSFNRANTRELCQLLDAGKIKRTTFVCSMYFARTSTPEFDELAAALTSRGHSIKACRSHAKLLLVETTDARWFTFESSGNLRSCRNAEQLTVFADRVLVRFHRHWRDELLEGGQINART